MGSCAEEYEGKSKLKVKATGTGDLPLSDEEIVFGGLRSQTGKFFCLMCDSGRGSCVLYFLRVSIGALDLFGRLTAC